MTHEQLRRLRTARVSRNGNRIDSACQIVGATRMDIARAKKFTPQYIADVVHGRIRNLRLDNAYKFADFFGCSLEDLFPSRAKRRLPETVAS